MDLRLSPPLSSLPLPGDALLPSGPPASAHPAGCNVLFTLEDWMQHAYFPVPPCITELMNASPKPPASPGLAPSQATTVPKASPKPRSSPKPQPEGSPAKPKPKPQAPPPPFSAALPAPAPPPAPPPQRRRGKRALALPVPHRVYSALTRYEHQQYLALRARQGQPGPPLGDEDRRLLDRLHLRVEAEQREYRAFKRAMAPKCTICLAEEAGPRPQAPPPHRCNNHLFMFPAVETTMRAILLSKRFRKQQYPPHYKPAGGSPIRLEGPPGAAVPLQRVTPVPRGMGRVPAFRVHNCAAQPGLCEPWHYVDPKTCPFQIAGCAQRQYPWTKSLKVPALSSDRTALDLCAEHGARVALASSAFTALALLCAAPEQSLVVPFKVIEEGGHRIVLLDKPLPQERYTCRELNRLFYKTALIADGIDPTQPGTPLGPMLLEGVPDDANLLYHVFQLGPHRLVIRHRVHGMEQGAEPVYIASKMEYNNRGFDVEMDGGRPLEFERITDAEFLKYYFSLLLRPTARLVVGRINVYNSTLVRVDSFRLPSLQQYLKSQPALPSPEASLAALSHLLTPLEALPVGDYVLRHAAGTREVTVLQACPATEATFNLHEACDAAGEVDLNTVTFVESSDEVFSSHKVPNTFPLPSGMREFSWASRANRDAVNRDVNYNFSVFLYTAAPHRTAALPRQLVERFARERGLPNPQPAVPPPEQSTHQRKRQRTALSPTVPAAADGPATPTAAGDHTSPPPPPPPPPPTPPPAEEGAGAPAVEPEEPSPAGPEEEEARSPEASDDDLSLGSDDDGDASDPLSDASIGLW